MTTLVTDAALADLYAGLYDAEADDWGLLLVDDTPYTPGVDPTVQDLLDLGAVIAFAILSGVTINGDELTCDPASVTSVPSGQTVAGVWLSHGGASPSLSRLVGFTDEMDDSTPISYLTDGSDLIVEFTTFLLSI